MTGGSPKRGALGHRIRAVDPNTLWKIVMLRGLGFTEDEISSRLISSSIQVSQPAVSYHLRRLKRLSAGGNEEVVFARVMAYSSTAIPSVMAQIVQRAKTRGAW
ncbi:MAG: ArsR family transcriptional regulator [Euryarchaeota archaeon]|nr:ArsR family transcriptional regulator [Euryarchaeota archaeon]MDE1837631.1 ArsR family transcriptional regulator [Euryarchaeota archaeon]MDE1880823.1 ArsR family transcriptional regulator [Euryarchaeota archaeon]MDE2045938.1 ArsR family transcriptional regulator [Thermoplasmata archaeon]